jgi:hypothetical protein
MKRTTANPEEVQALQQRFQTLSMLQSRLALAANMGQQYGTDRDIYQALGYPATIEYNDYKGKYLRHDMSKAIIDRPVNVTWRGDLKLTEPDNDDETQLEKGWVDLEKRLKVKSRLSRLDKLTGIGRYGVLLLGLSDVREKEDTQKPAVGSNLKLKYLKPFGEGSAQIHKWEDNPAEPRYGQPSVYRLTIQHPGSDSVSDLLVHHSRVIHVVDSPLESEIEGAPRLEVVYNRLMDLEKLVGGSAEMFWRGARPGYTGDTKEGYTMTPTELDELQTQIDEYEHNLRRILVAEGVDMKALDTQVSDPKSHVDVVIQMISAVTGIPKRILTGSERGELSSQQDQDEWMAYIETRRQEQAEPYIIRPFIDKCIELGILPKPGGDGQYSVEWEELFSVSDKDKTEIGKARAEALSKYMNAPGADYLIPPEAFMRHILYLDDDQIELINQEKEVYESEQEISRAEEEIIGEESNEEEVV